MPQPKTVNTPHYFKLSPKYIMKNAKLADPIKCPKCLSGNLLRLIEESDTSPHYARLTCGDCHKFVKWLKEPSGCLERQAIIDTLLQHRLGNWDTQFLVNIRDQHSLSDKQKIQLNRISMERLNRKVVAIEPEKRAMTVK